MSCHSNRVADYEFILLEKSHLDKDRDRWVSSSREWRSRADIDQERLSHSKRWDMCFIYIVLIVFVAHLDVSRSQMCLLASLSASGNHGDQV